MTYNIVKADLENDLLYDTIVALQAGLKTLGLPLYVVGATARDIAMNLLHVEASVRRTLDLDVAIALSDWGQFDRVTQELQQRNFKKDNAKQRFYFKGEDGNNDFEVDVVPFGGVEIDEMIGWPPEGNPQMSVRCFRDVMAQADTVVIDGQYEIMIAPLCGQFLIKLDTWIDRNMSTDKDARDMLYIMENFFSANVEVKSLPPVLGIEEDDFDTTVGGARWIAYELRNILSSEHIGYYTECINQELKKEEGSRLVAHFIKYMPLSNAYDLIRRALRDFLLVLNN